MRSARIRTRWKAKGRDRDGEVSIAEHAVAVAAVAWRVSLTAAKNLHQQEFVYRQDAQRLGVMREYLYFFIHAADRCLAQQMDDEQRAAFITQLSYECRRHYLENQRDIIADGLQPEQFIDELNQRMDRYADTRFVDAAPGYEAFRALGMRVQDCLGEEQTNKWSQDQVLNIDGPEAFRVFSAALSALNQSASRAG